MAEDESVCYLLDLSDDVLLHIFSYLHSWDLLNLLETCERLAKVAKDYSLWRIVDLEDKPLTSVQIKRRVLPCLHSSTSVLHVKGRKKGFSHSSKSKSDLLTPSIAQSLGKSCPSLQKLLIKEAIIDARKFKLVNYGVFKELKSLSLVGCELVNLPSPVTDGSYFRNMHVLLPCLQFLEVSHCKWINDYDLMVLSKLDSLKKLVLKCDLKVGFTIAYLSISFRFGFRNLEELDLRGTSLQNSDVQSVLQSGKLKSLAIGPVGRVQRLSDLYSDQDDGLNLVMSDPRKKDEPKQQVVVLNLGPNGPRWIHADDEDLDKMGLQWVKNGLRNVSKPKSAPEGDGDDEKHYFFGKEGELVSATPGSSSSEAERLNTKKRALDTESSDESEDEGPNSPKRLCVSQEDQDTSEAESEKSLSLQQTEPSPPDDALSDIMITSFRNRSKHLESLVIAGCAVTNEGLLEIVKIIPTLKRLDVSRTHVTPDGVNQAQTILPGCKFISNSNTDDVR